MAQYYKRYLNDCVRGVCDFLRSVSLQQKFEMADQCYSSFLFGKQKKIHQD